MIAFFWKTLSFVLFVSLCVLASPGVAQISDYERKLALAEQEYVRACKRLDRFMDLTAGTEAARIALEEKILGWEDRANSGARAELTTFVESGVLSRNERTHILRDELTSHGNIDVQNLINRRAVILLKIQEYREQPDVAALLARSERNRELVHRYRKVKFDAGEKLEELRNRPPFSSTLAQASPEIEERDALDDIIAQLNLLEALDREPGEVTFSTTNEIEELEESIELDLGNLNLVGIGPPRLPRQLRRPDDTVTVDPRFTPRPPANEDEARLLELYRRGILGSFGFGIPFENGATFEDVSQGLNTEGGFVWDVSLRIPSQLSIVPNWDTSFTVSATGGDIAQDGHFNIPSGVPGPSTGNINYLALMGGIGLSRPVSDKGEIVLDLSGGLGRFKIGPIFNAEGTVPVARLGATYQHEIAPGLSAGPYASVLFPLGKIESGFSGTDSVKLDPMFMIGLNFTFGAGRAR